MVKAVKFECFSGISGDMALGAFVDAGVSFVFLCSELKKLHLHEFSLVKKKVRRAGISATKVDVVIKHGHYHSGHEEHHHHAHAKYSEIVKVIKKSGLSAEVKKRSLSMFERLGAAEAKIHDCPIEEVHFHEIGAVDTIADICGAAVCMDYLEIERAFATNIDCGGNITINSSHGALPNPAPATVELLKGFEYRQSDIPMELVTPTGACILAEYAENGMPYPIVPLSAGYGAGGKDIESRPNVLRITIGEANAIPGERSGGESETAVIEANLDDMLPLAFESVMENLFAAGALDVFFSQIQMKKNRPGVKLTVICEVEDIKKLSAVIFRETTTFGVRFYKTGRMTLERNYVPVTTKFGKIRIKTGSLGGELMSASPEYADCKKLAAAKKIPLKIIYEEAKRVFKAK